MTPRYLFFILISVTFITLSYSLQAQNIDTSIPVKNQQVIDTVLKYGPAISSTYRKAVCTELVIKILEKFHTLSNQDKSRIRIITDKPIRDLIKEGSPVPKGIYYALTKNKMGKAIDSIKHVQPGDFVQFWTSTWGHCGIVKQINLHNNTMDLYSSFPSTNGYGIQRFAINGYCYFVRLK